MEQKQIYEEWDKKNTQLFLINEHFNEITQYSAWLHCIGWMENIEEPSEKEIKQKKDAHWKKESTTYVSK